MDEAALVAQPEQPKSAYAILTPLGTRGQNRFATLVLSEFTLMIKGLRWWWYVVAAGLLVAEFFVSPTAEARQGVLLAAWIWPVLVWSQMGCRESLHATQSLIFSAEHVVYRQLAALWMAGVLVAFATGAGTGIRLLLSSNWPMAAGWFAGALFIPSLALVLGVWSGGPANSSRPFTRCGGMSGRCTNYRVSTSSAVHALRVHPACISRSPPACYLHRALADAARLPMHERSYTHASPFGRWRP